MYIRCATLNYRGWCKLSAVFGFRLPDDLKKYLERRAKQCRTSISHYIVMLIFYDMMDREHGENMERLLKDGTKQD